MVCKRLKRFDEAKKNYNSLRKVFCQEEGFDMMKLIIKIVLIPL